MRHIVFSSLMLFVIVLAGCEAEPENNGVTLSGKIAGTNAIAVVKNTDLNRNKIEVVKQFRVGTDGFV